MKTPKPTRRAYTSVRKVAWDALWHAVFTSPRGVNGESWDRVTQRSALAISKRLV